jgi:hypothetical protein
MTISSVRKSEGLCAYWKIAPIFNMLSDSGCAVYTRSLFLFSTGL